ncbi:MAG: alkaline phosphatase D family protein [Thermodesulfobacteriota bacterium]|nr:alkaline phosphatase D family protein [Thermodesulfobacteriota bacterium]
MKQQHLEKMALFPKFVSILILVSCVCATGLALDYRPCTADESSAPPSVLRLILKPDGLLGDYNQWAVSSGDKLGAILNEAEFVYPLTGGSPQYFTFQNAPEEIQGKILATRLWVRAKGHDTGKKVRRDLRLDYCDPGNGNRFKQKIMVSDAYEYYYAEWEVNPQTRGPWQWNDVNNWHGGVASGYPSSSPGGVPTGANVSTLWLEVIFSSDGQGTYLTHVPVFSGVTEHQIKVWCRASNEATVTVRYSKSETIAKDPEGYVLGNDYWERQPDAPPSGKNDYTCITTAAGLDSDTTYYFTFLVDGIPVHVFETSGFYEYSHTDPWLEADHPYWSSLPRCATFPSSENTEAFEFVFGADNHPVGLNYSLFAQMTRGGRNPRFLIDLGDHYGINSDEKEGLDQDVQGGGGGKSPLWPSYKRRRGFSAWGRHLTYHVLRKMPLFRIWSDHDYVGNNSDKCGDMDGTNNRTYNAYDAFIDYTPMPELGDGPGDKAAGDGDLVFVASEGDATTVTQDPSVNDGLDFTDAGVYPGQVVYDLTTGCYAVITDVVSSTTIHTTGLSSRWFGGGQEIRIKRGGLWYGFKYGSLAEFFCIDTRYKRDPNCAETICPTPCGGDMLDGTQFGVTPKASGDSLDVVNGLTISIPVTYWDNRTAEVVRGDVVTNVTDGSCTLIDGVFGRQITLRDQIFDGTWQAWEIRESGASDHRQDGDTNEMARARNIAAGHVQREWLVQHVNNSAARWKFICSELPFLSDEMKSSDKWADYDPLDAQRDYLKSKITAPHVLWLCGDRHLAALNRDTSEDNPWPEACCGLFHCNNGNYIHCSDDGLNGQGSWKVRGITAIWDGRCIPSPSDAVGGFGHVSVSSDAVTMTIYDQAGNPISPLCDCGIGVESLTMTIPLNEQQVSFTPPEVVIREAYTTGSEGLRQTVFSRGEPIQFHILYETTGDSDTEYKVKGKIRVFGDYYPLLEQMDYRYPGGLYHMVKEKHEGRIIIVPDTIPDGKVKTVNYKLKLKLGSVVLDLDKASSEFVIMGP